MGSHLEEEKGRKLLREGWVVGVIETIDEHLSASMASMEKKPNFVFIICTEN